MPRGRLPHAAHALKRRGCGTSVRRRRGLPRRPAHSPSAPSRGAAWFWQQGAVAGRAGGGSDGVHMQCRVDKRRRARGHRPPLSLHPCTQEARRGSGIMRRWARANSPTPSCPYRQEARRRLCSTKQLRRGTPPAHLSLFPRPQEARALFYQAAAVGHSPPPISLRPRPREARALPPLRQRRVTPAAVASLFACARKRRGTTLATGAVGTSPPGSLLTFRPRPQEARAPLLHSTAAGSTPPPSPRSARALKTRGHVSGTRRRQARARRAILSLPAPAARRSPGSRRWRARACRLSFSPFFFFARARERRGVEWMGSRTCP